DHQGERAGGLVGGAGRGVGAGVGAAPEGEGDGAGRLEAGVGAGDGRLVVHRRAQRRAGDRLVRDVMDLGRGRAASLVDREGLAVGGLRVVVGVARVARLEGVVAGAQRAVVV